MFWVLGYVVALAMIAGLSKRAGNREAEPVAIDELKEVHRGSTTTPHPDRPDEDLESGHAYASSGRASDRGFLQENKTTDFYFPTLAPWGAAVADERALLAAPPNFDQPHDRNAWVHYAMGDYPALAVQIDNDAVIPFYSVAGQAVHLLRSPLRAGIELHLGAHAGHRRAEPDDEEPAVRRAAPDLGPPVDLHRGRRRRGLVGGVPGPAAATRPSSTPPSTPRRARPTSTRRASSSRWPRPATCRRSATCGARPATTSTRRPPATRTTSTKGQDLVWQRVQAVIDGGGWADTTFILTWDDWGGYADSVPTPAIETVPDALHPDGFQAIGGSRIPLIMFGGNVSQGIDSAWHSHASIPKTIIDLLGLPGMGVAGWTAPPLAGRVDPTLTRPDPRPSAPPSANRPRRPRPRPRPPAAVAGPHNSRCPS